VVGWALARELFPERFTGHERVQVGQNGEVRIDVAGLGTGPVRFFRYLNPGNQEVRFFVGRDEHGTVQAAFDANELCYKQKRGYHYQGDGWLVCRKCDKAFRLAEVNDGGGGCKPVPLDHRLDGDTVVLQEGQILEGWRYFR
jgi:uncharacterized membrane protein